MGASFVYESFSSDCNLKESVESVIASDKHQFGHDTYNGSWSGKSGVVVSKEVFIDVNKAHDYLCDNTDKWDYELLAVKVIKVEKSKKQLKLEEKTKNLNKDLLELQDQYSEAYIRNDLNILSQALNRVKNQKSKFKTCEKCSSKISIGHLSSHRCPVCGNKHFCITNSELKKIERLKEKEGKLKLMIDDISKEIEREIEAIKSSLDINSNGYYWLVGSWCPS